MDCDSDANLLCHALSDVKCLALHLLLSAKLIKLIKCSELSELQLMGHNMPRQKVKVFVIHCEQHGLAKCKMAGSAPAFHTWDLGSCTLAQYGCSLSPRAMLRSLLSGSCVV